MECIECVIGGRIHDQLVNIKEVKTLLTTELDAKKEYIVTFKNVLSVVHMFGNT